MHKESLRVLLRHSRRFYLVRPSDGVSVGAATIGTDEPYEARKSRFLFFSMYYSHVQKVPTIRR